MSRGRYWHWMKKPWLAFLFPILGLIFLGFGAWLFARMGIRATPVAVTGFGIYCVFRYWIMGIRFRRLLRQNPQYEKTLVMSFTDIGLEGNAEGSHFTSEWNSIYETVTTPDGFLIYPQKQIYYWIPRAAFESIGDVAVVENLLRMKTKNQNRG